MDFRYSFIPIKGSSCDLVKGGAQYALVQGKSGGAAAPRPNSAPIAKPRPVVAAPPKVEKPVVAMKENKPNAPLPAPTKAAATKAVISKVASQETPKKKAASASSNAVMQASIDQLKDSNDQLSKGMSEMRLEMDGLEKERDFYFEKLRQVEIIMQELEDAGKGNELTASVFKILYATADGFEQLETAEAPATEEVVDDEPVVAEEVDFVLENSAVEAM
jgi:RP/EB family microtubule-associated protein